MDFWIKMLIITLNLFGVLLGLATYYPQLTQTNPLLWIFIIDCPLAAFFVILFLLGVRNPYFEALMRTYAFKYAIWTIVVTASAPLLLAYEYSWVNILLHFGLLIESFMWIKNKLEFKHFIPSLAFLLSNDFFDYFYNTHPTINNEFFLVTAVFTFLLSVFTVAIFVLFYKKFQTINK